MLQVNVQKLRELSKRLYDVERVFEETIRNMGKDAGVSLSTRMNERSPAYRVYCVAEKRVFKPYVGDDTSDQAVWGAIEAGEAFPKFMYMWLPAGDYADWWNISDPATRRRWIEAVLSQSNWSYDEDDETWYKLPTHVNEDGEEVLDLLDLAKFDDDDAKFLDVSTLAKIRGKLFNDDAE